MHAYTMYYYMFVLINSNTSCISMGYDSVMNKKEQSATRGCLWPL